MITFLTTKKGTLHTFTIVVKMRLNMKNMNWIVLFIVVIAGLFLVIFTIIKNLKDEKDYEENLKNDFPKSLDQKGETDEDGL